MARYDIGSLVRARGREWVVIPSDRDDVLMLRPLGGIEAETCGIYLPLEGGEVSSASFAPPEAAAAGDFVSGRLLRDAARLTLRSGAGPFRALGHLGIRPRPYQLVPLLMALRLDPARLLIADDVGIGKTVEAGLIARELLDRGEVRRLCVLCPPHLCDQWQRELKAKFDIDAVVVRSSTAAALEKGLPMGAGDAGIYQHYPFTVVSIDYAKGERRRDAFLRACPELVIVDEAHTATDGGRSSGAQQQRYELVRALAADAQRHLLLLTATPHSGVEDAFRSLLGLLRPDLARLSMDRLTERERDDMARHFVQRRRPDVQRWLGESDRTPFPQRESAEITYALPRGSEYRRLFDDVYAFTSELVRGGTADRRTWQQRARYWAALALLRCVMSSPAAAEKALRARASAASAAPEEQQDADRADAMFSGYVYDPTDQEGAIDQEPSEVVEQGSPAADRTRLSAFATRAAKLRGEADAKLMRLVPLVEGMLRDGFSPIIYCRYIATANYLKEELDQRLRGRVASLEIKSVTGERTEEERESMIADLERSPRRVLVATDCLSEGINLQQSFDAIIHYDLPWNPNRLEQREGRVDRYGQPRDVVRTSLIYGKDNPMDEAVMKVLLRKAASIHRALGISVPLPMDSATVVDTLIASLFTPAPNQVNMFDELAQLSLLDADQGLANVEQAWDRAAEREKESRTRFAQRRIKPEEVARELEETDAALGDPAEVERFVRKACERLGAPLVPASQGGATFDLSVGLLPPPVRERVEHLLPRGKGKEPGLLRISFADVAPQGAEPITRTHALTTALADHLLELALTPEARSDHAARCGLIRTHAVERRTVLLLLRVRMLIQSSRQAAPALAEELVVCGYTRAGGAAQWLGEAEALRLLEGAAPAANVEEDERRLGVQQALDQVAALGAELDALAQARAQRLHGSHQRVRAALGSQAQTTVTPRTPDVLGVYVLLPA